MGYIWGSYDNIPKAILYLLTGDYIFGDNRIHQAQRAAVEGPAPEQDGPGLRAFSRNVDRVWSSGRK